MSKSQLDQSLVCVDSESERMKFLSEASMILNSSLDYKSTIKKLTSLAIPLFGDWCYVHLVKPNGVIELADFSAKSSHLELPLQEFASLINSITSENAVSTSLRTRKSIIRRHLDDEYYQKAAFNQRHLVLFRLLTPKSVIVSPLISRGNLLGSLTVSFSSDRPDYTEEEIKLIEEVANRAAIAIDNANLYKESQEAIKLREEFLSIASHELKTPITSLKLLTQMTMKKIHSEDTLNTGYIEKTYSKFNVYLNRMSRLIEDMLDMTTLQHGSFKLNKVEMDLVEVLKSVVERMEPELTDAGNCLSYKGEEKAIGYWDSCRIEQVITNIICNAIKYAPGSPIDVSIIDRETSFLLAIQDQGMGISEENLEKVFLPFEKITSDSNISGVGLGLYISKNIVEAHQGKIWIESEVGKGSTFYIELNK